MVYLEVAKELKSSYETVKTFPNFILKGHTKTITALKFDNFGQKLFSVSKDSSLIQWDIETNKKLIMSYGGKKDPTGHYDQV